VAGPEPHLGSARGDCQARNRYDTADAREYDAEKRGHLEAQIANAADELAYTATIWTMACAPGCSRLRPELAGLRLWELGRESIAWHGETNDQLTRHRFIRRPDWLEVGDLVQATNTRIEAAGLTSVEALQRLDHNVIGWSEAMGGAQPRAEELPVPAHVPALSRGAHAGQG